MQQAILGGVPGVVDLRFSLRNGLDGEWQGTFVRGADHGDVLDRVMPGRQAVLETTLEEERRTLPVTITASPDGRLVSFWSRARSVPTDGPFVPARSAMIGGGHDPCPSRDHGVRASTSTLDSLDPGDPPDLHDRGRHLGGSTGGRRARPRAAGGRSGRGPGR